MLINKKIFSLFAANCLLTMAYAQSSVTVYGIADMGITYGSGSVSNRTQMAQGNWAASRLGFRGSEDLGGGMAVGFALEAAVNLNTGAGGGTNTNNTPSGEISSNDGMTFGRRAYLSFSAPLGELRMGREYAPVYWNTVNSDVFGLSGAGSSVAFTNSIAGSTRSRVSNSLSYLTPKIPIGLGLQYTHFYGQGRNEAENTNSKDGSGDQIRLAYDKGSLSAAIAYGRTKYSTGDVKMSSIYGGWDFKVAKVVGMISKDEVGEKIGRGLIFGTTIPVGNYSIRASYSQYKTNALGSPKSKKIAIGGLYNLSKRTRLYLTFANVSNSGGAKTALNGSITDFDKSSRGFDFGIAHNF